MITQGNLKEVLIDLGREAIQEAIDQVHDWVKLELHTSNAGGYATIESIDYSEEEEQEVTGIGNVFCDKDNLLILIDEVGLSDWMEEQ